MTVALLGAIRRKRTAPRDSFTPASNLDCPTGASVTLVHMYRVPQLAEKYDVTLVENEIYSDLYPLPHPLLASLDQLKRVVYISSFSKAISPNLRVGHMAGHPRADSRTWPSSKSLPA